MVKVAPEAKWYVLHGFNKRDKDATGFLGMNLDKGLNYRADCYKIVKSIDEALKFPDVNVYGVDKFGTPEQWREFFRGEDELSCWKFKLMKVKPPRDFIKKQK